MTCDQLVFLPRSTSQSECMMGNPLSLVFAGQSNAVWKLHRFNDHASSSASFAPKSSKESQNICILWCCRTFCSSLSLQIYGLFEGNSEWLLLFISPKAPPALRSLIRCFLQYVWLWQGKLLLSFFILHTLISQINLSLSGQACKVTRTGHKSALNKWSTWHRTSASFPSFCCFKRVWRPPWHRNSTVRPNINTSHRLNWALMEARRAETEVETEMWACMNLINSLKLQMTECSAEVDHSLIYP